MDYNAEGLIPVMAHIAKNVVKVNEGLTKHMVSVKLQQCYMITYFTILTPICFVDC